MLGAIDAFNRLFSNTNPPLSLIRNLGLVGELPSLARRRVG